MNIVDQQTFRDAMSCMGAAVNIITTDGPAGRAGFTASAVCSVTDTPPTLLVCLNRGASVWPVFNENRTLCVNTLSAGQEPLSNLFGGKTPMEHRFAAARWQTGVTGRNMDPYMGRAFVGYGLATMLSGSVGGSGVTTYAENIGVMAVTKVYSTLVFVAAAVIAMLLGFSPKFGALIHTIPAPVIGGASIVVFGLIAVAGARIWVQNRVDLSQNGNLIMVAVTLVLGAGDFALTLGGFTLGGIGTATFGAILLNALLSRRLVDVPPPEVVHQEP